MQFFDLVYEKFQSGLAAGLAAVIVYLCFSTLSYWHNRD